MVVEELERAELFTFSGDAIDSANRFCAAWLAENFESDLKLQGIRELALISAAEFSLIPEFLDPLASRAPYQVRDRDAELALLKTDTSTLIPIHLRAEPSAYLEPLVSRYDLSIFSADIAKLQLLDEEWWEKVDRDHGAIWRQVEDLRHSHLVCPWMPARMVANSPLLQIQGLLWMLRMAISRNEDYRDEVPKAIASFVSRYGVGGGGENLT
ncbi:hypothetical protein [Kitasatospora paranensis]|uniref:Uncharacterized protein n=1 Tax=Kitasatospora paranensis TaxID=258053 RepID=A0ABW2FZ87_9ACTN